MHSILTILLVLAQIGEGDLPGVGVTIAPDQPLPHLYEGDPLILEFFSVSDLVADISVRTISEKGVEKNAHLSRIVLRAQKPYWHAFEDFALEKGRYSCEITIQADGRVKKFVGSFCRIERPSLKFSRSENGFSPPLLGVFAPRATDEDLSALLSVGISNVTLDLAFVEKEDILDLATDKGFLVAISIDSSFAGEPDVAAQLAKRCAGKVSRWEVNVSPATLNSLAGLVSALHENSQNTPVLISVDSPALLQEVLTKISPKEVSGLLVLRESREGSPLESFEECAQTLGIERMPVFVRYVQNAGGGSSLEIGLQNILAEIAAGAEQVCVPAGLLFSENEFRGLYVSSGAMNRFLQDFEFVGRYSSEKTAGATALCFRRFDAWRLVIWAGSEGTSFQFDSRDMRDLKLWDASGNEMNLPKADASGTIQISVGIQPVYLSGVGGRVLLESSARAVQHEAAALLGNEGLRTALPADFTAILEQMMPPKPLQPDRNRFFVLARTFAFLERQAHLGGMPRPISIKAMAGLARLMQPLCIVEQEQGEAFVEPLQDILTRCSQYQSSFLTRTSNNARERGDWILAEVSRLVDRAKRLAEGGRPIEAAAVANIAEWRARSLEFLLEEPVVTQPPTEGKTQSGVSLPKKETEKPVSVSEKPGAPAAEPPESAPEKQVFRIEKGDNPSAIARKHGVSVQDILKWNNWDTKHTLHIGDEYVVYKSNSPQKSEERSESRRKKP